MQECEKVAEESEEVSAEERLEKMLQNAIDYLIYQVPVPSMRDLKIEGRLLPGWMSFLFRVVHA